MSSLKEFMNEVQKSRTKALPESNTTLPEIQLTLTEKVGELLEQFPDPNDEQQKFSQEVSRLVQDEIFLSELSERLSEPLSHESEDEFVARGSDLVRQMLYKKLRVNIKSV
jgi:hypothetical protein